MVPGCQPASLKPTVMNRRITWNSDHLTALLAASGGCLVLVVAVLLTNFISMVYQAELGSRVLVQVLPLAINVSLALLAFYGGAFIAASLPWIFGSDRQGPVPLLVATASLIGGIAGYFIPSQFPWWFSLLTINFLGWRFLSFMAAFYFPILLGSGFAARLACLIRLPRPTSKVSRAGMSAIGFLLIGLWAYSSVPTRYRAYSDYGKRTAWCHKYFGKTYDHLIDRLQRSPVLVQRLGSPVTIVPGLKGGNLYYDGRQRLFQINLEAHGVSGQALIEAQIITPYRNSAQQTYMVAVNVSSMTLYLNPEGDVDLLRMSPGGQSTELDVAHRVISLYHDKKYVEAIQAFEQRPKQMVAEDDPMKDPEFLLAAAKSYEFLGKNFQAAGTYDAVAIRFLLGPKPDRKRAEMILHKALFLNPKDFMAPKLLQQCESRR
jgi:hypothetical protein